MTTGELAAIITAGITGCSVVAMCFQIRSTIQLNRSNETFNKISELDKILYSDNSLSGLVKAVGLIEDGYSAIEMKTALKIFKKNKNKVFELLNFFESLSSAALSKNINKKILKQIYGLRIHKFYIKLMPFILIIADKNNRNMTKRPYQHFELLWREIDYEIHKEEASQKPRYTKFKSKLFQKRR